MIDVIKVWLEANGIELVQNDVIAGSVRLLVVRLPAGREEEIYLVRTLDVGAAIGHVQEKVEEAA